jgi:hypothetical protein
VSTPQRMARVDPEEKATAVTSNGASLAMAGPSRRTTPLIRNPSGGSTRQAAMPARKVSSGLVMVDPASFLLRCHKAFYYSNIMSRQRRRSFSFFVSMDYNPCKLLQGENVYPRVDS